MVHLWPLGNIFAQTSLYEFQKKNINIHFLDFLQAFKPSYAEVDEKYAQKYVFSMVRITPEHFSFQKVL